MATVERFDESLLYHGSTQIVGSILLISLYLFGFTGLVIISVASLWRPSQAKSKEHNFGFIHSMCFGDMIHYTLSLGVLIPNFIAGRWVLGKLGCLVTSVYLVSTLFVCALSLLCISMERYLNIIRGIRLSTFVKRCVNTAIWILSWIVVSGIPFYSQEYEKIYGVHPSKLYCMIAWWRAV